MPVVTISASYGAGGSQVGPRLAERLGIPFVDRAIPVVVAERLAVPLSDALRHDESVRGALERLLVRFAPAAQAFSGAVPPHELLDERTYLQATEQVIRDRARSGEAVILGRAAAVVLHDAPRALHVRLDGAEDLRLEQAMAMEGVDRETAQRHMRETDRAREAYARHFYGADVCDPSLYHLIVDSTVFGLDATLDLLVLAAKSR